MGEIVERISEEDVKYIDDSLFNITSFGTDMSFREIIAMYEENDLEKPELQRKYVWTKKEASRFIDSVLLGLPVPSIFLAKEQNNKMLIVDGLQRISTICDYVHGIFSGDNKVFKLSKTEDIFKEWRGKAYNELDDKYKRAIRTYTIHAIVFEQKYPKNDTGMYQIFERINTGGRVLKPQEIRNCIYHGKFNSVLTELNKNTTWRNILNDKNEDSRMMDVELVLRFFAFVDFYNQPEYKVKQINLTKYLNDYMKLKENVSDDELIDMKNNFIKVIEFLYSMIGKNIFRTVKLVSGNKKWAPKINPVYFDSICSATFNAMKRINLKEIDKDCFYKKYEKLIFDQDYIDITKQRTTDVENIKKRIHLASDILFGIAYE